ncbi:hypothetical protein HNQ56_000096 [Anaerotaenia torta]
MNYEVITTDQADADLRGKGCGYCNCNSCDVFGQRY